MGRRRRRTSNSSPLVKLIIVIVVIGCVYMMLKNFMCGFPPVGMPLKLIGLCGGMGSVLPIPGLGGLLGGLGSALPF